VYGSLDTPTEIDFYSFTPARRQAIPVQCLVALRASTPRFRPTVVLIGRPLPAPAADLPFPLPPGYGALVSPAGDPVLFFEPFSVERLLRLSDRTVTVEPGETYYLAVYEPSHYTGRYVLGLGTVENFEGADLRELVADVARMKLGLQGGEAVPWADLAGLCVLLVGLALGLGGTVAGYLALWRAPLSPPALEAARADRRRHALLAWQGLALGVGGAAVLYRVTGLNGAVTFQLLALVVLLLNGCWHLRLAFPRLPAAAPSAFPHPGRRVLGLALNTLLAVGAWAALVFFLAWHLLVSR
jgi:hypothetical protein